jgi:MSHA biogenesis protein MshE
MIAAAVHGVVAQRLVRRICTDCAQPATPSPNELAWLGACRPSAIAEQQRFTAGAGCTYCNLTGYRGRVAVYEILELDRKLADAVRRGDLGGFAREARAQQGYHPLAQGAVDLALAGVTSLGEAMAVGSGLEELVENDARSGSPPSSEAQDALGESGVEALLEQGA